MQKLTDFLEKNVEWLALGIGAVFLLYMVFVYVLSAPVGVQMGGQKLSLGEVDRHILNNQARALQMAMDPNLPAPDLSFASIADKFSSRLKREDEAIVQLERHYPWLPPQDLTVRVREGPDREIVRVTELPELPAPQLAPKQAAPGEQGSQLAIMKGNSSVALPPAPAAGAGAVAAAPPQPGGPAVIRVEAGGQGNFQREDRLWVSLLYKVDMADIAEAFEEENVFEAAPGAQTAFMQVESQRQERLPGGEWSDPIIVPYLKNAVRPAMPPEEVANPQQVESVNQFINWAAQNAMEILKPAFYPVLAGDEWRRPDESGAEPVETEEQRIERLRQRKAEQDAERDQRRREALQKREQRATERPTRSPDRPSRSPTPRRSRDEYAPRDLDRPARAGDEAVRFQQVRRPNRGYEDQGDFGELDASPRETYPTTPGGVPPESGQPTDALQEMPPEITRRFQPDPILGEIEMWVHDDTVEAGKTYRYRARYRMANPILGWFGVAQPATLQNKVYVDSAWSEWSPNVRMDNLVQFFAVGAGVGAQQTIRFDVFKWEDGFWQQQTFSNLGPGDIIGGERDAVDFTTAMTIVDIRTSPSREQYVVLVDNEGTMTTRNLRTDQASAEYRDLVQKAQEDKQRRIDAMQGATGATGAAGVDSRRGR